MREFFRGWKRKVGCVTLVISLVFLSGWVRSISRYDLIKFPMAQSVMLTADSDDQSLGLILYYEKRHGLNSPEWGGLQKYLNKDDRAAFLIDHTHNYQWRCCGLRVANLPKTFQGKTLSASLVIVPYWSIVIPLTLLSAWLLLSKPRAKIKPPIAPANENA